MAKTVLITGSSRGIGLALVKECLFRGHKAIATCRNPDRAEELKDVLAKGGQADAVQLDVDDAASVKAAAEQMQATGLTLDVLINNAAVIGSYPGPPTSCTAEEMLALYKTNVVGPLLVGQAFLPLMNRAGPSPPVVVNVSTALASMAENSSGGFTAYRCSKAAVNMLNMNFARQVPDVIWVAIHPGWVDTDMGRANGGLPPTLPEESAAGIMDVASKMTAEDTGMFFRFNGEIIPF